MLWQETNWKYKKKEKKYVETNSAKGLISFNIVCNDSERLLNFKKIIFHVFHNLIYRSPLFISFFSSGTTFIVTCLEHLRWHIFVCGTWRLINNFMHTNLKIFISNLNNIWVFKIKKCIFIVFTILLTYLVKWFLFKIWNFDLTDFVITRLFIIILQFQCLFIKYRMYKTTTLYNTIIRIYENKVYVLLYMCLVCNGLVHV